MAVQDSATVANPTSTSARPLNRYEIIPYPAIPDGYSAYFEDKSDALILDLPSQSMEWPALIDEIIYVIWQTEHQRNIVGGINGYLPAGRVEVQYYTDWPPARQSFAFFSKLGLTHIVWHRSEHLVCHPPPPENCDAAGDRRSEAFDKTYSWLRVTPYFQEVFANDDLTIYELVPPQ